VRLFNVPDFVLARGPPLEAVIHPVEIYAPQCLHRQEEICTESASFMIGSVTKLTLYAAPLAAAHKDEILKRDAFKGAPRCRFDACRTRKSRDDERSIPDIRPGTLRGERSNGCLDLMPRSSDGAALTSLICC